MTEGKSNIRTVLRASTAMSALLLVQAGLLAAPALAQDVPPPVETSPTDLSTPSGPIEGQPTPSTSAQGESVESSQDIIVTGSRIPQANLESAAPITVVSDQDVKLSLDQIEDVLGQRPSLQHAKPDSHAQPVRRIVFYIRAKRSRYVVNAGVWSGDPNGTTQAADSNLIPSALVKRVEVRTGGASSVYGADAVAGVVNFIIDTDFSGIRLDGNFSIYQHNQHNPGLGSSGRTVEDILNLKGFPIPGDKWDGEQIDGTVTIGSGFDDGRGHALAYFGYRKVKAVLGAARDYSACTITNSNASGLPQCGGSATAFPGNVSSSGTSDSRHRLRRLGGTIGSSALPSLQLRPLNHSIFG